MSSYAFGFSSSIQEGKQSKRISDLGCKKKGTEYLLVPKFSFDGLITRCVVDFNLLLVKRCNISPTFTTIWSSIEVTETHSFCLFKTCKPSAEAPTNNVIKLDRKSTRLNSSHVRISYAVFCLKKKTKNK